MIATAATLIKEELGAYLETVDPDIPKEDVILGNIANLGDGDSAHLDDKIVITNVIIEEESSLKNTRFVQQNASGNAEYIEPPVFLNLYLLFSATFKKGTVDGYEKALHKISLIINFFQARNSFSVIDSPFSSVANTDTISDEIKSELRLRAELYTLTFEQINHLWGSLGGKQSPAVVYKIRAVKIQEQISLEAPVIEDICENTESL